MALVLAAMPMAAFAEAEEEPVAAVTGGTAVEISGDYIYEPGQSIGIPASVTERSSMRTDGLPAAYSSVTAGRTGAVKDQGSYGTCWAMATASIAETTLYENEKLSSIPTLSAMSVAGFLYQTSADPLGNASKDTITLGEGYKRLRGANEYTVMFSSAAWDNITEEAALPFNTTTGTMINNGEAGDETDYTAVAHVKDVHLLKFSSDSSVTDEQKIAAVKQLIYQYGSASYSYCIKQNQGYENSVYGSYYYDGDGTPNHMVTVVGWNDSFPKEYFGTGTSPVRPDKDGAWLIKNSWGLITKTTDGDTDPQKSAKGGYVWISYYCSGVDNIFAVYEYESADHYQNNYMYDGGIRTNSIGTLYNAGATYEVKASDREKLEAVSFMTPKADVSGTVTIYKNTAKDTPTTGTKLVDAQPFSFTYAGFHTIELENGPILEKGETYTIYFKFPNGTNIYYDFSQNVYADTEGTTLVYSVVTDYADDPTFYMSSGKPVYINDKFEGTFRIKGYTNNVYTVSYDAKGGSNAPESQDKVNKETLTLSTAVPTRDGFEFLGWSTDPKALSVDYQPGGDFDLDADTVLYAVWDRDYTVQVQSRIAGTEISPARVAGTGVVSRVEGTEITAEAATDGYTFEGWYVNYSPSAELSEEDLVTASLTETYHPEEDILLTAVYSVDPGAGVSLTVNGASFTYTDPEGAEKTCAEDSYTASYSPGREVTLTYTGTDDTFLYWADAYGNIACLSPAYTFTVLRETTVHAVTARSAGYDAAALVVFTDSEDALISAARFTVADYIEFPELPAGATAWSMTSYQIHAAMYGNRLIFVKSE